MRVPMLEPVRAGRRIGRAMDQGTKTDAAPELDAGYRLLSEEAAWLTREETGFLEVTGRDAADFLQGQLTNDIESLEPGDALYAALLDRKAHITADCRVLDLAQDNFVLVADLPAAEALLGHLGTYKIGREVELADLSGSRTLISVIGPATKSLLDISCSGDETSHLPASVDGVECLALGTDVGVDLIVDSARRENLIGALNAHGAVEVPEAASEILRIEAGRPRFGHELTSAVMPAEVGIVERAVSFEKGCYLGQEPVARLHYKGRPNRVLRGLRLSRPGKQGEVIHGEGRELGQISSACVSPALGPIALATIRREAEPGATVAVGEDRASAEVVELPLRGAGDLH